MAMYLKVGIVDEPLNSKLRLFFHVRLKCSDGIPIHPLSLDEV